MKKTQDAARFIEEHAKDGVVRLFSHFDADGIKGTNPKTHPAGFMNGENGDWHNDLGSVCYNCHTSATPNSQPSAGFCNYCHGI